MKIKDILNEAPVPAAGPFDAAKFGEIIEVELGRGTFDLAEFSDDKVLTISIVYDHSSDKAKISDLKKAFKGWFASISADGFSTTYSYLFSFKEDVSPADQKKILAVVKKVLDPYGTGN